MAITDTSPVVTGTSATKTTTGSTHPAPRGLVAIVGTGDHKTLGRLYLGFSLALGAVSLAVLGWSDLESAMDPASQTDRAFLNFTLGHFGLVFLFVIPLFIGLATAIVPLQIGARTIAFPRAAAAAFWGWLLSAALLLVSYLAPVKGGIGGSDANGIGLTHIALAGLAVSLMLATVCVLTTVITLRTPGQGLDMVPLFSWSMVVAGGIWILTLPVFVANLALIFIDQKYGAPSLFAVQDGQWAQLSWITTQPQVFAFAIPALGIVADVAATLSGARQRNRGALLFAIGAFGALSYGAYMQPAFVPNAFARFPFVVQGVLLILPLLGFLGGIGVLIRQGKPSFRSPLALSVSAFLLLILAVLASIPFGLGRLGLHETSKTVIDATPGLNFATAGSPVYTWGIGGLVLIGAGAAGIAGLFFWSSKITGRQLPEPFGLLLGLGALVGGLALGVPFLVLGFATKSDGIAESAKTMFIISGVGAVIALGVAAVAALLLIGTRASVLGGGAHADADAWGSGQTLEWATDSPPAPGNFGELPVVTSPEPLLDLAEGADR